MKIKVCLLLLLTCGTLSFAQDSLIVEKLKGHVYPFQFEGGEMSGAGSDFLTQVAKASPFFMIGEDHGMAEVPLFTAALVRAFRAHGYRYFATETGPFTAAYLQKSAAQKDWLKAYATFLKEYPWSIPFYSWQEECVIIDALLEQENGDQALLWGLDQEFAGGYRLNFQQLITNAQTDASRQVAQTYFDKTMKAYEASFVQKNPQEAFMSKVKTEDFEALKKAFVGQAENLRHIKELEESTHIYQLWQTRDGFQSNYLRAEMMKQHFLDYYQEAKRSEANPKVLFKFGANHVYRGANGLNVFDIGNFVSELASQMGTSSFHLYALGRKGTQNAYTPFSKSEADKKKAYDPSQYLDRVDFSPILAAAPEQAWAIVDLRPLRKALFNRQIRKVNPGLEKTIWSYDAILVIPEVSASTGFE